MVNIGIIGAGIGRHHALAYKKCAEARLVALCDSDAARSAAFAEEFGLDKVYSDHREMLKDRGIDAVSVCAPNHLHEPMSIAALAAGKHVLCEKPMATTAPGARRIAAAAKRSSRVFMMAFNNRFRREYQWLKRHVDGDGLGEIYFARAGWIRRKGIPGIGLPGGEWFGVRKLSGGGPLIDLGVHMLNLALWLMGDPKPVYVMGKVYSMFGPAEAKKIGRKFDVEDMAAAMITLANGATIHLETSWHSFVEKERRFLHLLGTKGGADLEPLRVYADVDGLPVTIQHDIPFTPGYDEEIRHFIDCIGNKARPLSPAIHGVHVQEVLDAIYKSARLGRGIKL